MSVSTLYTIQRGWGATGNSDRQMNDQTNTLATKNVETKTPAVENVETITQGRKATDDVHILGNVVQVIYSSIDFIEMK